MPIIRPPLTLKQILAWADAYRRPTGSWPSADAGSVPEAPGEMWGNIEHALREGGRGLRRGGSLARLLDRCRRGRRAPRRPGRPWTPGEDELLRTLPPKEVAERTGRTLTAVYLRRHALGLSPVRRWRE